MTTDREAHDTFKGLRLKNPRWTWKDYEMVSEVLNPANTSELEAVACTFAARFAEDNPSFKRDRFLKACGVLE